MRTIRFAVPFAALITVFGVACSNTESSANEPAKAPASTAAKTSNDPLLGPEDAISSQEDANKAAEQSINDANADAEMEKLEKELGQGGGGGG
jgi:hypothetical protein